MDERSFIWWTQFVPWASVFCTLFLIWVAGSFASFWVTYEHINFQEVVCFSSGRSDLTLGLLPKRMMKIICLQVQAQASPVKERPNECPKPGKREGTETLPSGIVEATSDLERRHLWKVSENVRTWSPHCGRFASSDLLLFFYCLTQLFVQLNCSVKPLSNLSDAFFWLSASHYFVVGAYGSILMCSTENITIWCFYWSRQEQMSSTSLKKTDELLKVVVLCAGCSHVSKPSCYGCWYQAEKQCG